MNDTLENAYALVLADLEDRNSHTIGRLLAWHLTGEDDEIMYRAWLTARNFIEHYERGNVLQLSSVSGNERKEK